MSRGKVVLSGELVSKARQRLGLSQEDVAIAAEVHRNSVSNAETGKEIGVKMAKAIADALGMSIEQLTDAPRSIAAEPSSRSKVACLPAMPRLFIGRNADLKKIHDRLLSNLESQKTKNEKTRLVISGWPGVGKTTLSRAIAHDETFSKSFPDGVLWCSLGHTPSVRGQLSSWAAALGFQNVEKLEDQHVANLISGKLANLAVLLVVDDVYEAVQGEHFLLGGNRCATIFTTRFPIVFEQLSCRPEDEYRLAILSEEESLELLREFVPHAVEDQKPLFQKLVSSIERLPLSLQVVGRMLQAELRRGGSIDELLSRIINSQTILLNQPPPSDVQAVLGDRASSVLALLDLSTKQLDPGDLDFFISLAPFVPKPANFHAKELAKYWGTDPLPILGRFVDRGLVEFVGEGRFQIHSLLVAHAKQMASENE